MGDYEMNTLGNCCRPRLAAAAGLDGVGRHHGPDLRVALAAAAGARRTAPAYPSPPEAVAEQDAELPLATPEHASTSAKTRSSRRSITSPGRRPRAVSTNSSPLTAAGLPARATSRTSARWPTRTAPGRPPCPPVGSDARPGPSRLGPVDPASAAADHCTSAAASGWSPSTRRPRPRRRPPPRLPRSVRADRPHRHRHRRRSPGHQSDERARGPSGVFVIRLRGRPTGVADQRRHRGRLRTGDDIGAFEAAVQSPRRPSHRPMRCSSPPSVTTQRRRRTVRPRPSPWVCWRWWSPWLLPSSSAMPCPVRSPWTRPTCRLGSDGHDRGQCFGLALARVGWCAWWEPSGWCRRR